MLMYLSDSLASPNYNDGLTVLRTDDRRFKCPTNASIFFYNELDSFEDWLSVVGCQVSNPAIFFALLYSDDSLSNL